MTPTLAALRRAVLLHPADTIARRVYADACLESGDPAMMARGEFILLQCDGVGEVRQRELIRRWPDVWMPADTVLWQNQRDGERWRVSHGVEVQFARGFVAAVYLSDPTAGVASDAPWSETTIGMVADSHARTVAALFAEQPLERVVIDFGEAEEWRVEVADEPFARCWRWFGSDGGTRWSNSFSGSLRDMATPDCRQHAGAAFVSDISNRLLTLGHRILAEQRTGGL